VARLRSAVRDGAQLLLGASGFGHIARDPEEAWTATRSIAQRHGVGGDPTPPAFQADDFEFERPGLSFQDAAVQVHIRGAMIGCDHIDDLLTRIMSMLSASIIASPGRIHLQHRPCRSVSLTHFGSISMMVAAGLAFAQGVFGTAPVGNIDAKPITPVTCPLDSRSGSTRALKVRPRKLIHTSPAARAGQLDVPRCDVRFGGLSTPSPTRSPRPAPVAVRGVPVAPCP